MKFTFNQWKFIDDNLLTVSDGVIEYDDCGLESEFASISDTDEKFTKREFEFLDENRVESFEELEELDHEEMFEEMLNEETVGVCGMLYPKGRVLKEIDPIAFRCGANEYLDSILSDGDVIEFGGIFYKRT